MVFFIIIIIFIIIITLSCHAWGVRGYKKQTGPMSMPNSWSGAPTSIGAKSMMGRREVFVVLYSMTVLPQAPV